MQTVENIGSDGNIANTLLCEGLTLKQWIEKSQKPRTISLWGVKYKDDFVPELCSIADGDGLQLIYFGTLDQRPYYWLMLIDSKHDIESNDFDVEGIVIEKLEEDFGGAEEILSEEDFEPGTEGYDTYDEYYETSDYPRVYASGFHWGLIVNMVTGERG